MISLTNGLSPPPPQQCIAMLCTNTYMYALLNDMSQVCSSSLYFDINLYVCCQGNQHSVINVFCTDHMSVSVLTHVVLHGLDGKKASLLNQPMHSLCFLHNLTTTLSSCGLLCEGNRVSGEAIMLRAFICMLLQCQNGIPLIPPDIAPLYQHHEPL